MKGFGISGMNPKVLLQTRPRLARAVSRVSGAALVVIGTTLLAQQVAS